jgi:outer membrane protein assembly factor BamB
MTIDQLIFVGLNGYAVALDRETGSIVWSNNELKSGMTTLLLDGDRLIVSTGGHIFCLDPLTGQQLWYQPMAGYGASTSAALLSVRGQIPTGIMPVIPHSVELAQQNALLAGS